ncbi:hypothetical protein [Pseudomonas citronellolis]|uniref:hypothetical protein n=1 Tax=Pseudomonas citronellolis TaxID=53408 RepID=UPI000945672F|nr:hypothetical protein [Pseudomonas citronellolis]
MSEVAGRKVVNISGKEFVVKELTVADIREMLRSVSAEEDGDVLGDMLLPDIRLHDLSFYTTLTKDQIEEMLPSQLHDVAQECKAMNRHFFDLGERLINLQRKP